MGSKWKAVVAAGLLGITLGTAGCIVHDRPGYYGGSRYGHGPSDRYCRDSHGHRVECRNYGHDDRPSQHYDGRSYRDDPRPRRY